MPSANSISIPNIDISPFSNVHPSFTVDEDISSSMKKAAEEVAAACGRLGFVSITGHGVRQELLDEAFAWSKKLFDLSYEEKMKAPHPEGSTPHRGYSQPGRERVYSKTELKNVEAGEELSEKITDYKESYEVGSEENEDQGNIWIPEDVLPGFRTFMTNFYWELNETANIMLKVFAVSLGLDEKETEYLFGLHSGHGNQLRLLHYPPVSAEQLGTEVVGRLAAHTDWSTFTFLFQDDCGGLELEDPEHPGTFVPAVPQQGALVLNVGDQLMRISNDRFRSATHRVILPALSAAYDTGSNRGTKRRYSIPYFVSPDQDALIKSLASQVGDGKSAKYEPVVFKDYSAWMSKYMYQSEGPVLPGPETVKAGA